MYWQSYFQTYTVVTQHTVKEFFSVDIDHASCCPSCLLFLFVSSVISTPFVHIQIKSGEQENVDSSRSFRRPWQARKRRSR